MMNMVNGVYPNIPWVLGKNGELKKENYDACDSLICALAYVNINHHGIESPVIEEVEIEDKELETTIHYTTKIWNRVYDKKLNLKKSQEPEE